MDRYEMAGTTAAGLVVLGVALAVLLFVSDGQKVAPPHPPAGTTAEPAPENQVMAKTEIQAARAELSAEDQRLVEAQDFCPVMPDKRLGVMGPPIKVMVKEQPVFLCCKGCRRKALADPNQTLAKVEELKVKVQDSLKKP